METGTSDHYITTLNVKQIGAERWQLLTPLTYRNGETLITAPTGFITDFASTPQIVWTLGMPKSGVYDSAACIHDLLYTLGGRVRYAQTEDGWAYRVYTKADADSIFYDAMGVLGVGQPKRWLMYKAVEAFGRGSFAAPPAQDANGLPIGAA